jgi:hypothetical protein
MFELREKAIKKKKLLLLKEFKGGKIIPKYKSNDM